MGEGEGLTDPPDEDEAEGEASEGAEIAGAEASVEEAEKAEEGGGPHVAAACISRRVF